MNSPKLASILIYLIFQTNHIDIAFLDHYFHVKNLNYIEIPVLHNNMIQTVYISPREAH